MQPRNSRLTRRSLLRMAGLGGAAALLASCAAPEPTPTPAPAKPAATAATAPAPTKAAEAAPKAAAPPSKATALKITHATDWNSGPRKQYMDQVTAKFMEENPNVQVEVWHMGGGGGTGPGGYDDIQVAMLATGTAADSIYGWALLQHEQKRYMADLTDAARRDNFRLDDYWHVPFEVLDKEGKIYGIPFNIIISGWMYNKTLFDKAGIPAPTDQWTWDDMLKVAKTMTKPQEKQYGFWAKTGFWGGAMDWLHANRASWDKDNSTEKMANEAGIRAFTQWLDAIYKDKVSPAPGEVPGMLGEGVSNLFATGKVAITTGTLNNVATERSQIGDRFEWSFMPSVKSATTGKRGIATQQDTIMIPKVTQERGTFDASFKYATFLIGEFGNTLGTKLRPSVPPMKKFADHPDYLAAPPHNMQQIKQNLLNTDDQYDFELFHPGWGEWRAAITREWSKAFTGEVPPDQALKNAAKAADAVSAKHKPNRTWG